MDKPPQMQPPRALQHRSRAGEAVLTDYTWNAMDKVMQTFVDLRYVLIQKLAVNVGTVCQEQAARIGETIRSAWPKVSGAATSVPVGGTEQRSEGCRMGAQERSPFGLRNRRGRADEGFCSTRLWWRSRNIRRSPRVC